MKIDFIGTGMMGSLTRGNSSILVNDEILFDIGSGVLAIKNKIYCNNSFSCRPFFRYCLLSFDALY